MKEQICETLLHEMVHLYNLQVGVQGGNNNLEVNILMTDLVEDLNNDQEDN